MEREMGKERGNKMNTEEALRDYILELERKNRSLKIQLGMYEKDAADLIEKHGCDPDDKIDREVLKRMINYLIGENRRLKETGIFRRVAKGQ